MIAFLKGFGAALSIFGAAFGLGALLIVASDGIMSLGASTDVAVGIVLLLACCVWAGFINWVCSE
jgi:hypothetical protein